MTKEEFDLVSKVIERAWARDQKSVEILIDKIGALIVKDHRLSKDNGDKDG